MFFAAVTAHQVGRDFRLLYLLHHGDENDSELSRVWEKAVTLASQSLSESCSRGSDLPVTVKKANGATADGSDEGASVARTAIGDDYVGLTEGAAQPDYGDGSRGQHGARRVAAEQIAAQWSVRGGIGCGKRRCA